jgi:hypothetical protein
MGGSQTQVGGSINRRNRVEPERLEPTLAERLDASVELFSEAKAAVEAGADEPTLPAEARKPPLRERVSDFRKRLVLEDAPRRWWQPKNR